MFLFKMLPSVLLHCQYDEEGHLVCKNTTVHYSNLPRFPWVRLTT